MKDHIFETLNFYYPQCIDHQNGGFMGGFLDDGTVNDTKTKQLVGVSRFTYIFSVGALLGGPDWCLQSAKRGIQAIQNDHLDPVNGGYFFQLSGQDVVDDAKMAYGHAFVLLAASLAYPSWSLIRFLMCLRLIFGIRKSVCTVMNGPVIGLNKHPIEGKMLICICAKPV
ncbi:AGE family epimerase/isomerase [Desemzia sp. C1]|uniref:AGE family epimerase/isomerase n=1 Tax=Desemzia sp. C1 TaxID=2892016 RepID=UPI002414DEE3|nr:AGE family epimerase/isomerase [Desemzia sp. C1]